jgi:hypothetical protein
MNESSIRQALLDLNRAITALPSTSSSHQSSGTYLPEAPPKDLSVDESLDLLKLQIKYLLFDLEATRRENRYLRKMLESRPRREQRDDEDVRGF